MKWKVLVIVLLVAVGAGAVYLSAGGALTGDGNGEASSYLTAKAARGDVVDEVAATGTIAPSEIWALGFGATPQKVADDSTPVGEGTWTVTSVAAEVGRAVKAGDVLATASTDDLRTQLASARASLAAAKLEVRTARGNLGDASGTAARRQAKIALHNARNAQRQASQDVADIEEQIALATLRSPIDGTVTTVNVTKGLDSTGTALTIASTGYEVVADVVEEDVSSMSLEQAATVTVDAVDADIDGTVSEIAPSAENDGAVVSFPVTVTLTGAPAALRSGMTADITIVTAAATDVLAVPAEALRGTAGDYRVLVLGPDSAPTPTPVTVGLVTSALAEITSGLAEGDVVVTGTASSRTPTLGATEPAFGGGAVVVEGGPGPGVFPRP